MVTVLDFIARLVGSVFELVVIFITEVALSDPLAFVSFAIGGALTTFALVAFAYLALGALADAVTGGKSLGGGDGTIGRAPPPRE